MLRTVLKESCKQQYSKSSLTIAYLSPRKTIKSKLKRHVKHYEQRKDEFINDVLRHMDSLVLADRQIFAFIGSVQTLGTI